MITIVVESKDLELIPADLTEAITGELIPIYTINDIGEF